MVKQKLVGLDYHTEKSALSIETESGEELYRGKVFTLELRELLKDYKKAKVLFEAGYGWPRLVKKLDGLSLQLIMCHPENNRRIATDRRKSDERDAKNLVNYLKTESFRKAYMPDDRIRDERQLMRSRSSIVREMTSLMNQIYGLMAYAGIDKPSLRLFSKKNRYYFDTVKFPENTGEVLKMLLESYDLHREQVKRLDRIIIEMNRSDPRARLLKTAPGIGDVTARTLLVEIGDIDRFKSADSLACYAGLVPGQRQSGNSSRNTGLTKEGSGIIRHVLVQSAWVAIRVNPVLKEFYENVKSRGGAQVAICAVARKLAVSAWHILKKNVPYKAQKPNAKDNPDVARGTGSVKDS
jgi:transposase